MRIIPLVIEKEKMDKARSLITSSILEIKPFVLKKAAVITTGSEVYKGRIQDTFTPVIQTKLAEFGCEMVYHAICDDDDKMVTEKINEALKQGVDIVLCTGGMSVDQMIKHHWQSRIQVPILLVMVLRFLWCYVFTFL